MMELLARWRDKLTGGPNLLNFVYELIVQYEIILYTILFTVLECGFYCILTKVTVTLFLFNYVHVSYIMHTVVWFTRPSLSMCVYVMHTESRPSPILCLSEL